MGCRSVRTTNSDCVLLSYMATNQDCENIVLASQLEFDVNSSLRGGRTLLGMVAEACDGAGASPILQPLLDHLPSLGKARDETGRTKLHLVASYGTMGTCFNLVLPYLDDINTQDNQGSTVLATASRAGQETMVQQLLQIPDIEITKVDISGRTALWWALRPGHGSIGEMLGGPNKDTGAAHAASEPRERFCGIMIPKRCDEDEMKTGRGKPCAFSRDISTTEYLRWRDRGDRVDPEILEICNFCSAGKVPVRRAYRSDILSCYSRGGFRNVYASWGRESPKALSRGPK